MRSVCQRTAGCPITPSCARRQSGGRRRTTSGPGAPLRPVPGCSRAPTVLPDVRGRGPRWCRASSSSPPHARRPQPAGAEGLRYPRARSSRASAARVPGRLVRAVAGVLPELVDAAEISPVGSFSALRPCPGAPEPHALAIPQEPWSVSPYDTTSSTSVAGQPSATMLLSSRPCARGFTKPARRTRCLTMPPRQQHGDAYAGIRAPRSPPPPPHSGLRAVTGVGAVPANCRGARRREPAAMAPWIAFGSGHTRTSCRGVRFPRSGRRERPVERTTRGALVPVAGCWSGRVGGSVGWSGGGRRCVHGAASAAWDAAVTASAAR